MRKRSCRLFFLLTILCWPILCNADTPELAVAGGKFRSPGWQGTVNEKIYNNFGHWYYSNITADWVYQGYVGLFRGIEPSIKLIGQGTGKYISFYGEGFIKYAFYLSKLHQAAPDNMEIPMHISFKMALSVEAPAASSVYYNLKAKLYLTDPQGFGYNKSLIIDKQTSDEKEKNLEYTLIFRATPTESMSVWINAEFYLYYDEYSVSTIGAKVVIDPIITIDPNFMVNIGGEDYPANQLYEVKLSQNLYSKPMPWMQLLLGD